MLKKKLPAAALAVISAACNPNRLAIVAGQFSTISA
ncbi:MAG: hypothetical protein ACI8TL_001529, partial [Natronomonas sp.]